MIASLYFKTQRFLRHFGIDLYVLPMPKKDKSVSVNGRAWTIFRKDTNWLRIPMYADLLKELEHLPIVGQRVIEVGGSEGLLRRELEKTNRHYTVAEYPEVDAEKLPYADGTVDILILDQLLEHLKHPWVAVNEVKRVLSAGGFCVCTTVFMYPLHHGSDYGDYYRFSPDGLKILFEDFEIICAKGWGSGAVLKLVYDASERGPEGQPPMSRSALIESGLYDYSDSMNYLMTWCIVRKR